jgi:hypothetical protein
MASQFQQLVDKCITDGGFRQQFLANRVAAAQSLGIEVSPAIENALNELDVKSITSLAIAMQGPAQFT